MRTFDFDRVERVLLAAEQSIRLLDRVTALNAASERRRLLDAVQAGNPCPSHQLHYAPAPALGPLRRRLDRLSLRAEDEGLIGRLQAERARELSREAEVAEALGTPRLRELSSRHFAPELWRHQARLGPLLDRFLEAEPASGDRIASDDWSDPRSLVSELSRQGSALGACFRIELRPRLQSAAASSGEVIFVRPGLRLTPSSARRIASHEILGHLLPRTRAASRSLGILRVGTAGACEDEEGRALLIEDRLGLIDGDRRRELALRHLSACWAREGRDLTETVAELSGRGADATTAVTLALRAQRGGGLGREVIYLPAWIRVGEALGAEPELEAWFEAGRVSVAAARALGGAGGSPGISASDQSKSTTTGA